MPFVPATNVAQVELIYRLENSVMENVIHYQRGGGWTTSQMNDLAGQLIMWFDTGGDAMFSNELSLVNVKVTDLTTESAGVVEVAPATPIIGTWSGGVVPGNVALCVTKLTASRGRSYRGRMYLPGMPDSQVSGSFITTAHLSIVAGQISEILTQTVDGVVAPMVVVSRFHDNAPRGTAVVSPVTSIRVNTRLDSQRRRLPGVGA